MNRTLYCKLLPAALSGLLFSTLLALVLLLPASSSAAAPAAPATAPRPATPAAAVAKPFAQPPAAKAAVKAAVPSVRKLHIVTTVEAMQTWSKTDPQHPGKQWSTATGSQRYELDLQLRTNGILEVRNLLDLDLDTRLEAKVIHLARQARASIEAKGGKLVLPQTPEETQALNRRFQTELYACNGEAVCSSQVNLNYAAIFAAMQYPEALEDDDVSGRYLYFLPFKGCVDSSRITMKLAIDGERFNKDVDRIVSFSERRSADTVNASDGLPLCDHFTAVIDTENTVRPLMVENIHVPSPVGVTEYTERGHTSRTTENQPMPGAVLDWMTATLRHATTSGKASATLPLSLSLNGISIWLGLWTGTANVSMTWSFDEVPASPGAGTKPAPTP